MWEGKTILRIGIISPDRELGDAFHQALLAIPHAAIVKQLDGYPNASALGRFLRAHAPEAVFVSVGQVEPAIELAEAIEAEASGTQIVAIGRAAEPALLLALMRAGIREFLSLPLNETALRNVVLRVSEVAGRKPPRVQSTEHVFAFLPAKAGVGASTIALNCAFALAGMQNTRVLLIDLDLNNGMLGFMLKLAGQYSVLDAAEHAAELDEDLWPKLVSTVGQVDVLPSGNLNPGYRIEPSQIRYLLDFARRNYKVICVDLSGMMEKYSVQVLHEARQIFMVSTQEIPPLHLGREKLNLLKSLDLSDRVSLLLNRFQKSQALSNRQIEELLGLPVLASFPNDYNGVHRAITEAKPVQASSKLGKCFREFAKVALTGKPLPAEQKRHFIDYFNIVPARYKVG